LQYFHNNVKNIRISILGWAFKKNTNDSRESASIFVAVNLLENGAKLNIYDPMVSAKRVIIDITLLLEDKGFNKNQVSKMIKKVSIFKTLQKCIKDAKAIVITTEWEEFKNNIFILKEVKSTKPPYLFDGRNITSIQGYQNTYHIGN